MRDYSRTFDWFDFPEGRIRYAGGSKGRDEPPIDVFSVEIGGRTYFGEIRRSFLADENNYNIETVSFGWPKRDWFGTEPDPRQCATFSPAELRDVQSLVTQAVPAWRLLENRPIIVRESARSHFMGEIIFRDGWALIRDESFGDGH